MRWIKSHRERQANYNISHPHRNKCYKPYTGPDTYSTHVVIVCAPLCLFLRTCILCIHLPQSLIGLFIRCCPLLNTTQHHTALKICSIRNHACLVCYFSVDNNISTFINNNIQQTLDPMCVRRCGLGRFVFHVANDTQTWQYEPIHWANTGQAKPSQAKIQFKPSTFSVLSLACRGLGVCVWEWAFLFWVWYGRAIMYVLPFEYVAWLVVLLLLLLNTHFLAHFCARHVPMMQLWQNPAKKGVRKRKGADAEAVKEQTNERTNEREQTHNMIWTMAKVECTSRCVCACVCGCVYTRRSLSLRYWWWIVRHQFVPIRCMHGWREPWIPPVIRAAISVLLVILIKTRRI